jgi:nitrite reductase/ring-hydroxylating ferredoxin subunit
MTVAADTNVWHKVAEIDELAEGRVKTVVAGHKSLALTRVDGRYGALDNRCPHQGGPLGDFAVYAESCGAFGTRVTDRAQLDDALVAALSHDGPALVDVVTDADLV